MIGISDEIVSIERVGSRETIDIEVGGNKLFFADDVLVHNSGMGKEELDLTNTSDSIGTAFTADIMIGVTQPDELRAQGKYRWSLVI